MNSQFFTYGNAKLDRYFQLLHEDETMDPNLALALVAAEFFLNKTQTRALMRAISEC
jgi:hypothetical protein